MRTTEERAQIVFNWFVAAALANLAIDEDTAGQALAMGVLLGVLAAQRHPEFFAALQLHRLGNHGLEGAGEALDALVEEVALMPEEEDAPCDAIS
jgi:hypothetical protein